jgi:hypothetical protein
MDNAIAEQQARDRQTIVDNLNRMVEDIERKHQEQERQEYEKIRALAIERLRNRRSDSDSWTRIFGLHANDNEEEQISKEIVRIKDENSRTFEAHMSSLGLKR